MAEERHCSECGGELPADAPQGLCPQCLMKLGLPTGAEADKAAAPGDRSDVPTTGTPPGRFVPPEPAQLARQFPQLEILELLGQGGMGAVYKARQKQLDRLVALKILPPEVGQDPAFAERFTREARSMAVMNHPHIVTVHDFGQTEKGLYYFVMEFVDGTDLRQVIQAGELKPSEALVIVPQICEALQFAHEEGIVHRDIKPENILMDKKGRVKIADFGLARLLDRPTSAYTLTAAGHKMGTPHYMAPEQIEHPHEVDHRADIYSLGVVFYEMLTGQLPIGKFAPPSQKVLVDVRLDKVVLKSLAYEPERRYQHASEVKTDVESISYEAHPVLSSGRRLETTISRDDTEAARRSVRGPAIGLMIAGILNGPFLPIYISIVLPAFSRAGSVRHSLLGNNILLFVIALLLTYVIWMAVIIFGATKMKELEAYWLAVASAILATIPVVPGCLIGLPIGIWALAVLTRRDVRQAFGKHADAELSKAASESSEAELIRQQVKRPAVGLLVTGIVNWVGITVALLILTPILARQQQATPDPEAMLWLIAAIAILFSSLIIFAALKMMRLEAYPWAVAGSILAMVTTPGNIIGLPIGVWALVVLTSRQVKAAFPRQKRAVDLSRQGKWNGFSPAAFGTSCTALAISLWVILSSTRETDPGVEVHDRAIWAAAIIVPTVFACTGLWRHSKYQGMKGKGFAIAALVITFAALVAFVVTIYYPVT